MSQKAKVQPFFCCRSNKPQPSKRVLANLQLAKRVGSNVQFLNADPEKSALRIVGTRNRHRSNRLSVKSNSSSASVAGNRMLLKVRLVSAITRNSSWEIARWTGSSMAMGTSWSKGVFGRVCRRLEAYLSCRARGEHHGRQPRRDLSGQRTDARSQRRLRSAGRQGLRHLCPSPGGARAGEQQRRRHGDPRRPSRSSGRRL